MRSCSSRNLVTPIVRHAKLSNISIELLLKVAIPSRVDGNCNIKLGTCKWNFVPQFSKGTRYLKSLDGGKVATMAENGAVMSTCSHLAS